jgi:hypothetical protein
VRRCGKRGLLLFDRPRGEAVWVQPARLRIEGLLERGEIDVKMARQVEEGEEVGAHQLRL